LKLNTIFFYRTTYGINNICCLIFSVHPAGIAKPLQKKILCAIVYLANYFA